MRFRRPTASGSGSVAFRAIGTTVLQTSVTSIALGISASSVAGDLLVACVMRRSAVASDPPAGWTLRSASAAANEGGATTQYNHIYTKTCVGGDIGATVTFSQASAGRMQGMVLALSGTTGTPVFEQEGTGVNNATTGVSVAMPSLTSAGDGRLGLVVLSSILAATTPTTTSYSFDTAFTGHSANGADQLRIYCGTKPLSSSATTACNGSTNLGGGGTNGFAKSSLIFAAP